MFYYLLSYIDRALTYEPNHGPALNRLMAYATAKVEGNVELKTVLARVIAEGKQPALAHLAMGNLCWIEGDSQSALFHFERAIAIRDDIVVVLNNLAWLISHDDKMPDFERAMTLVNVALEKQPLNANNQGQGPSGVKRCPCSSSSRASSSRPSFIKTSA